MKEPKHWEDYDELMLIEPTPPSKAELLFYVAVLGVCALFWFGGRAHGAELTPEVRPSWTEITCERVRDFMATHSEAEARAKAIEMHAPEWVIKKAERCLADSPVPTPEK